MSDNNTPCQVPGCKGKVDWAVDGFGMCTTCFAVHERPPVFP